MNNNKVFLNNVQDRINDGEFDSYLTLPFMNKKLLMAAIKGKIERRIQKGGTPMLTDAEIIESIQEVKETAGTTFYLLVNNRILVKNDDGTYELSHKAKLALRYFSR